MAASWTPIAAVILEVTGLLAVNGAAPVDQVMAEVLRISSDRPSSEVVEAAVATLGAVGLLAAGPDGFEVTEDGSQFLRRLPRTRSGSSRSARIARELGAIPLDKAPSSWSLVGCDWPALVERERAARSARLMDNKSIIDGLIVALGRMDAINVAIRSASDRHAALESLMGAPFDFTERQAQHILDMTVARQTVQARTNLTDESALLAAQIKDLERY